MSPDEQQTGLTYDSAGVSIEAQDSAIANFAEAVAQSQRSAAAAGAGEVVAGVGAFGAAFAPALSGYKDPVLVSSTDGLGTKTILHARFGTFELAGRDIVGTVLNDVLCSGALPLFMLDYIGWHGLAPEELAAIVRGVAAGCAEAGCALIGGELSEMRDIYKQGDFDLNGTVVGLVEREAMLGAQRVTDGSVLIGIASEGVHANGFSLVRKALSGLSEADWRAPSPGVPLFERMLAPTRCYAADMRALLGSPLAPAVQAAAHISGGGLQDNVPRVIPQGLCARVDRAAVRELAGEAGLVFDIIRAQASSSGQPISEDEMYHVFNMGSGFVVVVQQEQAGAALRLIQNAGSRASLIGHIEPGSDRFGWL